MLFNIKKYFYFLDSTTFCGVWKAKKIYFWDLLTFIYSLSRDLRGFNTDPLRSPPPPFSCPRNYWMPHTLNVWPKFGTESLGKNLYLQWSQMKIIIKIFDSSSDSQWSQFFQLFSSQCQILIQNLIHVLIKNLFFSYEKIQDFVKKVSLNFQMSFLDQSTNIFVLSCFTSFCISVL